MSCRRVRRSGTLVAIAVGDDVGDVSSDGQESVAGSADDVCAWCGVARRRRGARFCSKLCRQSAFRLRKRAGVSRSTGDVTPAWATAGRFAYADPPYIGLAKKYYGDQESYAGEVDHVALIESLEASRRSGATMGWALSASSGSLATLLPLCPKGHRVGAWVKPIGVSGKTWGSHSTWEPVIFAGGRPCRPGIRDWLRAMPARGGGSLPGRKPLAFCAWLFDMLGMQAGDELEDLFPGTGVIGRAWRELSATPRPRTTHLQERR